RAIGDVPVLAGRRRVVEMHFALTSCVDGVRCPMPARCTPMHATHSCRQAPTVGGTRQRAERMSGSLRVTERMQLVDARSKTEEIRARRARRPPGGGPNRVSR